MDDLIGRCSADRRLNGPWFEAEGIRRLGALLLLHSVIWTLYFLVPSPASAAALPASEFVVPGGPVITLQDGQRIEGHIIRFDQTNAVIRTKDGTERTLPRAAIDMVRFETVTGMEISGALIGWKPGVYELTTEETVVTVYSTMPAPPTVSDNTEAVAEATVDDPPPTEAADSIELGISDAAAATDDSAPVNGKGDSTDTDSEEQVAAVAPAADLEINVSADNGRENGAPVAFDVELSRPSDKSVVLIYATIDDTAIDGEDYEAARGVLVIKAGETSARIEALVINDDLSEDDEQLRLFLTVDPTVAVVKSREIFATIEDDDQG